MFTFCVLFCCTSQIANLRRHDKVRKVPCTGDAFERRRRLKAGNNLKTDGIHFFSWTGKIQRSLDYLNSNWLTGNLEGTQGGIRCSTVCWLWLQYHLWSQSYTILYSPLNKLRGLLWDELMRLFPARPKIPKWNILIWTVLQDNNNCKQDKKLNQQH